MFKESDTMFVVDRHSIKYVIHTKGAPKGRTCDLTHFLLPHLDFFRTNSYRGMGLYMLKFCADPKIFAAIKSLILASKN